MATANDIVKGALRKLGVIGAGETPSAEDANIAFEALNDLIESWSNERLMLPNLTQVSKALTTSNGTYSIGLVTGDINVARPVSIDSAFIRDSASQDSQVAIISDEQYSLISNKSAPDDVPGYLYYRPTYPLGQINLYPTPLASLTLYMSVWAQISAFATLNTTVALPPGYKRALEYNLAVEISSDFTEASQLVITKAMESKSWIKTANSKVTPILRTPVDFLGYGRGFDITVGE
jgi:hypothetical protein